MSVDVGVSKLNPNILTEQRCRTCLNELLQHEFHNINETLLETHTITNLLNFFIPNPIARPEISEKICDSCFSKLSSFRDFIQNFLKVEIALKDALLNLNNCNDASCNLDKIKEKSIFLIITDDSMDCIKLGYKSASPSDKDIRKIQRPDERLEYNIDLKELSQKNDELILSKLEQSGKSEEILILNDVKKCMDSGEQFHSSLLKDHLKEIHQNKNTQPSNNNIIDTVSSAKKLERGREKKRACPFCKQLFKHRKALASHVKDSHEESYFKCRHCKNPFFSKNTLDAHLEKFKDTGSCTKKKCKHCGEIYKTRDMTIHLRTHRLDCKHCNMTFINDSLMKKHNRTTHFKKTKRTVQTDIAKNLCFVCGKTFSETYLLQQHLSRLHFRKESKKTYYCDQCPKSCKTALKLRCHVRFVHEEKDPLECEKCGKIYNGQKSLKEHQKLKHPAKSDLLYECNICEKSFSRRDYYTRHKNSHAEPEVYNNSYTKRKTPRDNARKYIPVSDDVVCNICDKTFKSLVSLRIHLYTHMKMRRRFGCARCSLTFANRSNRKRHELLHKDPSFENSCRICHKNFGSQEELTNHMEKHKNLKYGCQLCDKKFPSKYMLKNHLFEHSDVDVKIEKESVFDEGLKPYLLKYLKNK